MSKSSTLTPAPLRGDEAELFRLHYTILVRRVQRGDGVPEAVAEDCASFAFMQLCRTQPDRCEQTPGWLRTVARHEAYAWHRHTNRCWSLDEPAPALDGRRATFTDLVPAPVDVELAVDAREALRSLAGLGDRRRTALTLKVAGYSYSEIQQLLGVTFTWINRHVTEGRAELRKRARVAEAAAEARCRSERTSPGRTSHAAGAGQGMDRQTDWSRLSDDDLLRSARREPDAFAAFYARHERMILAFFVGRVGNSEVAADLAAETFAAAPRSENLRHGHRRGRQLLRHRDSAQGPRER